MASDRDDIETTDDGMLLASGWFGYSCDACGCYHIDLLDTNNKPFASMVIDEGDLEKVAHVLLGFAAKTTTERGLNSALFTRH
jgi:hypothetical protein